MTERDEALMPFRGQNCPFCHTPVHPDGTHEAIPCPTYNQPYPIQQLAYAHLRLLANLQFIAREGNPVLLP